MICQKMLSSFQIFDLIWVSNRYTRHWSWLSGSQFSHDNLLHAFFETIIIFLLFLGFFALFGLVGRLRLNIHALHSSIHFATRNSTSIYAATYFETLAIILSLFALGSVRWQRSDVVTISCLNCHQVRVITLVDLFQINIHFNITIFVEIQGV